MSNALTGQRVKFDTIIGLTHVLYPNLYSYFIATFMQAGAYGLTFMMPRLFDSFGASEKVVGAMLMVITVVKTPLHFYLFFFFFGGLMVLPIFFSLNLRRANDSELACSSVANLLHRAKRSVSILPALIAASMAQPGST